MNEIDRRDAVDGPVVSEGGRSPSTLSTGREPARAFRWREIAEPKPEPAQREEDRDG